MLTTKEAAEYLGVTTGRIRQLIGRGDLVAEKGENGWMVSRASLDERKGKAKVGRPTRSEAQAKAKEAPLEYTLMSRTHQVAHVVFDRSAGAFARLDLLDSQRAPLPLVGYGAQDGHALEALNGWWQRRCSHRNEGDDAFVSLGLSLSDQFWLLPKGADFAWDDVNFFENAFQLGPTGLKKVDDVWQASAGLVGPDASTGGATPKRWIPDADGRRVLLESGADRGGKALCRVIATSLYRRLLFSDEYVEYQLATWEDELVSLCPCFLSDTEEFIAASYVRDLEQGSDGADEVEHYQAICDALGAHDAASRMDKMILCDFILARPERSWFDFGLIRDVESLKWRAAPLFGNGTCLQSSAAKEESLSQVQNFSWLQGDLLDGFADEVEDLLVAFLEDTSNVDEVCCALEERVGVAKEWSVKGPRVHAAREWPGVLGLRGLAKAARKPLRTPGRAAR